MNNSKIQNRETQSLREVSPGDFSDSQLFTKILEMIPRGELTNPRKLRDFYREIAHQYINVEGKDIHLITYFYIYNKLTDSWFKLPEAEEDIFFYTGKFPDKTVYESRIRSRELREQKKIRTFRQILYEKGERKYSILFFSRNTLESCYPTLSSVLLQVPLTREGMRCLTDELEITDPEDHEGVRINYVRLKKHFSAWRYVYSYITPLKRDSAANGASIFTSDLIPQQNLLRLIELLDIIFAHIDLELTESLLRNFSLRSAIAAIMSRNMSHNLGSHVLARIASRGAGEWAQHKGVAEILKSLYRDKKESRQQAKDLIFWSKDAELMALYIQQRMDFIAQVSSEWPIWTEPAFLLKNVMRWFLYQKHLLNYLAASEGLGAHLFHPRRHKENLAQHQGDIRFHIFLVGKELWMEPTEYFYRQEKLEIPAVESRLNDILKTFPKYPERVDVPNLWRNILLYTPTEGNARGEMEEDVLMAVPGGIVGYQAFYVILENIIRNAAKHGFVKAPIEDINHLDVVIEIFHDPQERIVVQTDSERWVPAWLLRIYDNVSFIKKKYGSEGVLLWGKKDGDKGINDRLGTSIIEGGLKKEDWGLAEMKIAAGYLQGRAIEHIGMVEQAITGPIVDAPPKGELDDTMLRSGRVDSRVTSPIIRAIESPIGTLGYEFYMLRPKTVSIIDTEGNINA